jgi:tricorn protease
VRNNNGGFVNVYAIDVFARRGYFNMLTRGFPSVSSRTSLGQRALELPTILVTAEAREGRRRAHRRMIIYTGGVTLIDGSTLRLPATKIFASDGTPMEMHPRPVDVPVKRPVGESYSRFGPTRPTRPTRSTRPTRTDF